MDFISYRGMPMNIVRSVYCERTHVMDDSDTTYLYTHWRGRFVCTFNPQAISFNPSGNPPFPWRAAAMPNTGDGGQPIQTGKFANLAISPPPAGTMPAITDAAIREYLSQPRGPLIISSLGNFVLVSPSVTAGTPLLCDARNGPIVRVNSIVEVAGERMWQIELEFETWIIENPKPSMIISNRWTAEGDTNWQHLTTRTYRGRVTVRADAVNDPDSLIPPPLPVGFAPDIDQLRQAFAAFTLPNNFQRQVVNVAVSPDGLTADYTVVDTEQLWNKNTNCPAVRIECQESGWSWESEMSRMMLAGFAGWVAGGFGAGAAAMAQQLPKYYFRVHVRAWGNAATSRSTIANVALGICASRVGRLANVDPSVTEIITSADLNNCVDYIMTRSWNVGDLGIAGAIGGAVLSGLFGAGAKVGQQQLVNLTNQSPNIDSTPFGLMPFVQATQAATQPNPPFPNAGGTRGTWLGNLVAQILENFHAPPAAPP